MTDGQVLTIRLTATIKERLDALASRTGRTPSELAAEALAEYLAVQEWQIAAIEEAVREIDAGAVPVDHARVVAWIESWGSDDELPCPR